MNAHHKEWLPKEDEGALGNDQNNSLNFAEIIFKFFFS